MTQCNDYTGCYCTGPCKSYKERSEMIIGLSGLKGAGKDAAGAYLVQHHAFIRESFAEPMKASAAGCFGIDPALWETLKNDPQAFVSITHVDGQVYSDMTVREFLQRYGTEAHREIPEFGQNVWTDMMYDKLNAQRVVITDSRFENECRMLKAAGGTIVVIERDAVVEGDGHASEAGLPDELVDVRIPNNGTLDDLYRRLDILVAHLLQREEK